MIVHSSTVRISSTRPSTVLSTSAAAVAAITTSHPQGASEHPSLTHHLHSFASPVNQPTPVHPTPPLHAHPHVATSIPASCGHIQRPIPLHDPRHSTSLKSRADPVLSFKRETMSTLHPQVDSSFTLHRQTHVTDILHSGRRNGVHGFCFGSWTFEPRLHLSSLSQDPRAHHRESTVTESPSHPCFDFGNPKHFRDHIRPS